MDYYQTKVEGKKTLYSNNGSLDFKRQFCRNPIVL